MPFEIPMFGGRFVEGVHDSGMQLSLKINFLHSHLNFFPPNLGEVSDELGLIRNGTAVKGKSVFNMLADYGWQLITDVSVLSYRCKSSRKKF